MFRSLFPLVFLASCARDLVVPPPTTAQLRGQVTKDGVAVAGAEVRLDRRPSQALTRADGRFTFKGVAPGMHGVVAGFDSDGDGLSELTVQVDAIELIGGDVEDLGPLELRPTGAVSGTVRANGVGLAGALVFVPGTSRVAFTDGLGAYALSGLPAGALQLAASAAGFIPQRLDVEVPSAATKSSVDFELPVATGIAPTASFTGKVRMTDRPDEAVEATVFAYVGARVAGAADTQDNAFRLGPLVPGVFSLRFDAPAHRTVVLPLEALGLEDVDVGEVWLEPGTPSPQGPDVEPPDAGPPDAGPPDAGYQGPLDAVRALTASGGDGRITLAWSAPAALAQRYQVYRGVDPLVTPTALDGGLTADLFFVDTAVTNYTRYVYRVTAVQGAVESSIDEAPQVQAYAGPGTVLTGATGTRTLTVAGNPHVVIGGDLLVLAGQTLTLTPGTVVQVDPRLRVIVDGTLVARGTATMPVVFTSRLTPAWAGLVFEASATDAVLNADGSWDAGSVLEHAVVEKSNGSGVTIIGSSPALIDSEIRENYAVPDAGSVALGGGLFIGPGSAPFVIRCAIRQNHAGLLETVASTQYGAGVYSEGDPVFIDNDISFNVLEASTAANSTSYGGGVFLKRGQATLCGNRLTGNSINGSGQQNTGEVIRLRGLGIAIEDGAHVLLGNTIESNNASETPNDFRGTVWLHAGNHVVAHNRIAQNAFGTASRFGGALAIETATVQAHFNRFEANALTGPASQPSGSAVYAEATLSDLRHNDFADNTPAVYELYNTGAMSLDLTGSWFSDAFQADGGLMPASAHVYRPAAANLSSLSSTPVMGAGPQRCSSDGACVTALGGTQRCHFGQCVPACLLLGCPALKTCEPASGACQ